MAVLPHPPSASNVSQTLPGKKRGNVLEAFWKRLIFIIPNDLTLLKKAADGADLSGKFPHFPRSLTSFQ